MREMNETSSRTKNINTTVRAGIDYSIISKLRFVGLASYTYSTNRLKEIYGNGTKAALDNRMTVDGLSKRNMLLFCNVILITIAIWYGVISLMTINSEMTILSP